MDLSYRKRLLYVLLGIVVLAVGGLLFKQLLLPDSFGAYGHYRPAAIEEEAQVLVRHGTNESCVKCHAWEAKMHKNGKHQTISCEFCHGPYADHVTEHEADPAIDWVMDRRIIAEKSGPLPVKKDKEITMLCLRCHNTEIKARSEEVIKTVAMPDHLKKQDVKLTHTCNQCHHVHAPLKYIIRARQITGMMEAGS